MVNKSELNTAGRGDPYWYEWFVGAIEVLNLLNPDSDVQSVSFQVPGIKGWDDVVVRLQGGGRRCYQVKHTRAEDTLTFGDLLQLDEKQQSLLGSLFATWKSSGLDDGATRCILYTNREAGSRGSTAGGIRRPSLLSLMNWLAGALPTATTMADLSPEEQWKDAWTEWRTQMNGSEPDQLAFLKSLEIRTRQDDLEGLVERVTNAFATAFGVSVERVLPMVDALHRALRKWTTGHAEVTGEDLYSELALEAEQKDLAPAPPPPVPFFITRVPIASVLEADLTVVAQETVYFLTAEPGAGKTSLLSWLANRREDHPFMGNIGLRFFCFEPIRPEAPFIAPDASRVRPSELWFSLLTQLREGLRGRLRALCVPLRSDLLTWQEARTHVIRLASTLGNELGRPFVIVIDGIDHAARAAQTMPQQSAEFFASLPSPDELRGKSIRLLVAGQPAATYSSQYPAWLVGPHPDVRKIDLPGLQLDDVLSLVEAGSCRIPIEEHGAVARLIQQVAKGNTLATVFAVAEGEKVDSVDELTTRLVDRRLSDGLTAYYASIWQYALRGLADLAEGVGGCLMASLSLARRGVTPEFLMASFGEWGKPSGWWATVLEELGPLLSIGTDGYRVRHNDVRVFLAGKFAALPITRRTRVASQLADHYGRLDCDRVAAHLQLLDLLKLAGRTDDFSRAFDVKWVLEAGALGIETGQLLTECEAAVRGLARLKEWPLVVSVACAAQTLDRLVDSREYADYAILEKVELPPFLPSEARVPALSQWSIQHLRSLVDDAERLAGSDQNPRALALLQRWLEGLDFRRLFERLGVGNGSDDSPQIPGQDPRLRPEEVLVFKKLGHLCRRLGRVLLPGQYDVGPYVNALFAFESGYVEAALQAQAATIPELFGGYQPRYLGSWQAAIRRLAAAQRWVMVREALTMLQPELPFLHANFRAEATAWALRSGCADDEPSWLDPIDKPSFGIDHGPIFTHEEREAIAPYLSVAYSLGWTRVGMDGRDIADLVCHQVDGKVSDDRWRIAAFVLYRASSLLGRVDSAFKRGGDDEVRQLVLPAQVRELLGSLWGRTVTANIHFPHQQSAAELAEHVVDVCERLGGSYDTAALDQATTFAAEFPVDSRRTALWSVLRRHGKRDLMRQWVQHWIGGEGKAWRRSHEEAHSVVRLLLPLAEELGNGVLVASATARLRSLLIGYRSHKEYGFKHVLDWFNALSETDPTFWRVAGWKMLHLCDICDRQGGDNRYEGALLTSISAAALGCGPSDWWALIEPTVASGLGDQWYDRTGQQLIEGVTRAVDVCGTSRAFACTDLPVLWSLGLAFSYWHDEGDNHALLSFREALHRVPATASERKLWLDELSRTSRSHSLDLLAGIKEGSNHALDNECNALTEPSSGIQEVDLSKPILPSVAASAVRSLSCSSSVDRNSKIDTILMAVGTKDYADWSSADSDVLTSFEEIARSVTEDQLWLVVGAVANGMDRSQAYRVYGVYPNLLQLSLARAEIHGTFELAAGLDTQLEMLARWAGSGSSDDLDWPSFPSIGEELAWQTVAVRLLGLLLTSISSEILTSTLEAAHALVAARPAAIAELFASCTTEWQRHWLLSATESWAALHPAAVSASLPILSRLLTEGSLLERLQSWLILNKMSQAFGAQKPKFPMTSAEPTRGDLNDSGALLYSPTQDFGLVKFSNAYSSAELILSNLRACGWDLGRLEAEIGKRLLASSARVTRSAQSGPIRRGDMTCLDLAVESAVGGAILDSSSIDSRDEARLARLAQGLLGNDDAWLQRFPPRRASASGLWASSKGYGEPESKAEDVRAALRSLALSLDVVPGWQTFSARVFDCSRDRDYLLCLWQHPHRSYERLGQVIPLHAQVGEPSSGG